MWVWSLGWEDPLEEGMATHSNILAWEIPWTEKPGGLQSIKSYRVRYDWSDWARTHSVLRQKWGRGSGVGPFVPGSLLQGSPSHSLLCFPTAGRQRLWLYPEQQRSHVSPQVLCWHSHRNLGIRQSRLLKSRFFNWRSAAPTWKTESSWSPMVPLHDYENEALCICYFKSLHPAY